MSQRSEKREARSQKKCVGLLAVTLLLVAGSVALAADAPHGGGGHAATSAVKHGGGAAVVHEDHATGPVFSADDHWTRKVVIGIGVMFVAAMLIGPAYRMHLPEEVPMTHSHDEPPGTSGHHGKSGALDAHALDGHRH
jgi:hypothetical protein